MTGKFSYSAQRRRPDISYTTQEMSRLGIWQEFMRTDRDFQEWNRVKHKSIQIHIEKYRAN